MAHTGDGGVVNPRVFHNGKVQLYAGNCIEILRELTDNSIDAVVTDPPYHLTANKKGGSGVASVNLNNPYGRSRIGTGNGAGGFMGKAWDGGDIAFRPELWAEVLRVLKPGGHMVCFGGTRTYHRMTCAIEDAGFEIRDAIMWHYGSGFPKSHDVSKGIDRAAGVERDVIGVAGKSGSTRSCMAGDFAGGEYLATAPATDAARRWQGYGTALKPSTEIICLARKPISEATVAANVLRWGTGALNIDGCRIGTTVETWPSSRSYAPGQMQPGGKGQTIPTGNAPAGRWPANLCHDGSPEVLAGFPEVSGVVGMTRTVSGSLYSPDYPQSFSGGTMDSGSAARFFATFPVTEDDLKWKSRANGAENCLFQCHLQSVDFAPLIAAEPQLSRIVQNVKSAGCQCDSCATVIARGLVALRLNQGLAEVLTREFISEQGSRILSRSLVLYAEGRENTDIILTIPALQTLLGSVLHAIEKSISSERSDLNGKSEPRFLYTSKADHDDRLRSLHPTVKPVDLMQWLVRLVCPKGATVLDMFAGTGTTGAAAFIEGRRCVLIEREAEYLADIEKRMELLLSGPDERSWKLAKPESLEALPLFALTKPAA